jgi:coenzyme F420-0:L-glutamate ligase/coenzyme F420-1:gamma-L-glutamate ligase
MSAKPIIAILGGTGQEGKALALRWTRAGYRVVIGSRDASRALTAAAEINGRLQSQLATGTDLLSAATGADIVVLTVPYAAQIATLEIVRAALDGKILVDVTVPLVPPKVTRAQLPEGGSAVAKAQALLGPNVKVVSAFQNISHDVLAALDRSIDCDVLVCGDDKAAREAVVALARDAGMRAWHGGVLANSAAAEALTSVLIFLNGRHKVHGAGIRITGIEKKRSARLSVLAPCDIPEVRANDDLASIVLDALARDDEALQDGDVVILAQKIVSKAEGRSVALSTVQPSKRALELAGITGKDARLVELILNESIEVLRQRDELIVVEHRLGYVLANAGIDASNVEGAGGEDRVLLLPADPDASAAALRKELETRTGLTLAVVINDSLGRAWRRGTVGTALGSSGLPALLDLRGKPDRHGRLLKATEVGIADEVAATASLLMGQASEGRPVVVLRGLPYPLTEDSASSLIRGKSMDLFR